MCTVLLPPGDNPIAVNKYIKYQIYKLRLFTKKAVKKIFGPKCDKVTQELSNTTRSFIESSSLSRAQ